MAENKVKILLAGGGTLGSVSPLLAVAEKYPADYVFVGSKQGPERKIVEDKGIEFIAISSGKLRRYFSWKNIRDWHLIKFAFYQSFFLLGKHKPDLILTAGSFVAVPLVWAAWLRRVPVVVHQQDIRIGLANKLMAPFAKKITVSFKDQVKNFKAKKTVVTGNPVRTIKPSDDKPIVLITGGGLGARGLNSFVAEFIPKLLKYYEVHHILGSKNWDQRLDLDGYFPYEFVKGKMTELLARAEIVISRGGMQLTSEVASLKKALILIPIPKSHQELNANFFAKHNAAFKVKQGNHQIIERYLEKLISNDELRHGLGENLYKLFPKNPIRKYTEVINEILSKK